MSVHGLLLLDKPYGLSSNNALIKVKDLLNAKKAGHTGTLDPCATGLLPLCFGEATKFSKNLLEADKVYEAIIHLGITTDTGDITGKILSTQNVNATAIQITQVLQKFQGTLTQIPPMYSALKYDGKPLYKYARAGITLIRKTRIITIKKLLLLSYKVPYLHIRVMCSKGTYIRVLAEDIGIALGCGGHLKLLRRISIGALTITSSVTLKQIIDYQNEQRIQILLPLESLLTTLPIIQLNDTLTQRFLYGQRLALYKEENIIMPIFFGRVRVYHKSTKRLLGTGIMSKLKILMPERLMSKLSVI